MNEMKFAGFTKQILENRKVEVKPLKYVEMTIEEAMKCCNRNKKVLVAIQDLEDDNIDIVFVKKKKSEYSTIFEDVKTVASICDDFVRQLNLFTEKQEIHNIEPHGMQKTILLRE